MKLWLLRPVGYDPGDATEDHHPWFNFNREGSGSPWDPWCDKAFGFVVRAESEAAARAIVVLRDTSLRVISGEHPWASEKWSTCVELTSDGPVGILIQDFARA
jgi:hypothetical protein